MRPSSSTSGGAARSSVYRLAASTTLQPAASISAFRRSAVAQSRARRASDRASARARISGGAGSGAIRPSIPARAAGGRRTSPSGRRARRGGGEDDPRQDPRVREAAEQHGPGPPVEPAVREPADERAQRLDLGLAQVDERERQRGDD